MNYDWAQEHVRISNLLTRLGVIVNRVIYFSTTGTYIFLEVTHIYLLKTCKKLAWCGMKRTYTFF